MLNSSEQIPKHIICDSEISIEGGPRPYDEIIWCECCKLVLSEDSEISSPYYYKNDRTAYICKCPICKILVPTDRSACMCGSCPKCGYRWNCNGYDSLVIADKTFIYPTTD
jgi:hypothetical protein